MRLLMPVAAAKSASVETGQPQSTGCLTLAHEYDAERIFGVDEPVRQLARYNVPASKKLK
jgi:hypothetical protein